MLGLPFSIYIFAFVALVMIFIQRRTLLGLLVAAIGDNERAAYLSAHRTRITKTLVYGISGFGAALAGIIQTSQVHTAIAIYGPFGTELDVIAAVVLGGTSIMGGKGSVARTLLGVFFLGIVNDGMNILNVSVDIQTDRQERCHRGGPGVGVVGTLSAASGAKLTLVARSGRSRRYRQCRVECRQDSDARRVAAHQRPGQVAECLRQCCLAHLGNCRYVQRDVGRRVLNSDRR